MGWGKIYIGSKYIGEMFIDIINNDIILTNINTLIIKHDNILGIRQNYTPNKQFSQIFIETYTQIIKPSFQQKLHFPSFHYIKIITSHSTLVKLFSNRYNTINQLPYWSVKIPLLTPFIRRITQYIILLTEISLCIWSMYQIMYRTPIVWIFIETVINPLMRPFINVGKYINLIFQLKILSYIQFNELWNTFGLLIAPISNFIGTLRVLLKPLKIFRTCNTHIRVDVPFYIKIFNFFNKIWKVIIQPIKHIYILIKTPFSGELGKKINDINKKKD